MIPAATATAPNDISTLIASDPVSRLARGQLALRYQPGDVENDPDGSPPSHEYSRHILHQFERPLAGCVGTGYRIVKGRCRYVAIFRTLRDAVPTALGAGALQRDAETPTAIPREVR